MNRAAGKHLYIRDEDKLQKLKRLRPIDDELMRCIFKDNVLLAQRVLCIITGKPDLKITKVRTQEDLKRLAGARSLCLDVLCTDDNGKLYNLEIQRGRLGAGKYRARYHSSALDIENLKEGQDFSELPDTYVIFITEEDIFGLGRPVYPIERVNLATDELFGEGQHILYVNGAYRGDSDIGRLMHDFSCYDPEDMYMDVLADSVRPYKQNTKGADKMSEIVEEIVREAVSEAVSEAKIEFAQQLIVMNVLSFEQIAQAAKLSLEEVKELALLQTV
ncbi:MAG: PD-(D/E)XK nuclease family transposase [Lachnospiraceae bacterium]|nr:PD-(D/E)XK nuclease family transposase [Lachnospiraceae bacterium]